MMNVEVEFLLYGSMCSLLSWLRILRQEATGHAPGSILVNELMSLLSEVFSFETQDGLLHEGSYPLISRYHSFLTLSDLVKVWIVVMSS